MELKTTVVIDPRSTDRLHQVINGLLTVGNDRESAIRIITIAVEAAREDMTAIANQAFKKGREFERRMKDGAP